MVLTNRTNRKQSVRDSILSSGQKLKLRMTKGPSKYFLDKFGGVHFVKISAGNKAVNKLGWRELSWSEAYKLLMKKSWKEKK